MAAGEPVGQGGGKAKKRVVALNLDVDVDAKLGRVAELTSRSRSNVANLVLGRGLDVYLKDPELL